VFANNPELKNDAIDANQPEVFGQTTSQNLFNFRFEDPSPEPKEQNEDLVDEDDRFFGTRIIEAKRILKSAFRKK